MCVCDTIVESEDRSVSFLYPDGPEQASTSVNLSFYIFQIVTLEPFHVSGWL